MSKTVNRKNNCTVHFMVNEGDINDLTEDLYWLILKKEENFTEIAFSKTGLSVLTYPESLENN